MEHGAVRRLGPLRWGWLAHPRRTPSEAPVRGWLGAALQVAPAALALVRDAHGRPRLGGAQAGDDVNWSHSGDQLMVVLGSGVQVGVDLEWLRPRPRASELARRYFAAEEAAWLAGLPDDRREHAFLRLWCAKEAVLKAHGRGLAFGLDRLRFVDRAGELSLAACDARLGQPRDWRLRELAPAPGYLAAVAWRPVSGAGAGGAAPGIMAP